jgi:epoxyqueuosine reductase QueG
MDRKQENFNQLAGIARSLGATSFGVADLERMKQDGHPLPQQCCPEFPYGIAVGFRLSDAIMGTIENGPTTTYRYHYRQVNAHLDRIALQLTARIQSEGFNAMPIGSSHILNWEKNTGQLSHKWVARYAGLGWIGRNNLLVNPMYGSRMRYVTVLTDMPLPTGEPTADDCGECRDCIDACPAGAIGNRREDFRLDLCSAQLDLFKKKWNMGQQICGVCIRACQGPERRSRSNSE